MRKTRKSIYMITADGRKIFLHTVRNEETAKLMVEHYKRRDRYEVEVEGYADTHTNYIYE